MMLTIYDDKGKEVRRKKYKTKKSAERAIKRIKIDYLYRAFLTDGIICQK